VSTGRGGTGAPEHRGSIGEVAAVFLKLGLIGFGGPAAHVALMRRELVERREWVDEPRFLDLFAVSNLIPGPSSTEMAILLGYERAGWPALIVAGALFILPATLLVLLLAWAYVRFGSLPQTRWVLYGVGPAVIGIVADALWKMGRTALRGAGWVLLAAVVTALSFLGVNLLVLVFGGGVLATVAVNRRRIGAPGPAAAFAWPGLPVLAAAPAVVSYSAATLFLTFLKIGAVLYGSGYVLLAFLRADFVQHLHWLTNRQLIDAVSIGQVTPGPLFTTATFVGYLTGGAGGALLATLAIFLPSFVFVAVAYPMLPAIKASPWATGFLRGATASSLGLMLAVTFQLGRAAIVDPFTAMVALAAFLVLRRFEVSSVWLVLGSGAAGVLAKLLG
jgi:chromate transporter